MKLSIIIPAYNEEERLVQTLTKVYEYLVSNNYDSEVIIVNDGSADNTEPMVREKIRNWPNFRLITYKENKGKGYAVKTAMLAATGDWRLFMDADNSTDISEIEKFWEFTNPAVLEKFSDVIIGSRYIKKDSIKTAQPFHRILISRGGNLIIRLILGIKSKDTQCGFKMFSARAAEEIFSRQTINRWGFDMEILIIAKKHGLRIKEVPVDWYNVASSKVTKRMTLVTLHELFEIRRKLKKGIYD